MRLPGQSGAVVVKSACEGGRELGLRRLRGWAVALATTVLAGCGGGDTVALDRLAATAREAMAEGMKRAQAFLPSNPVPADAHQKGMWSPVYPWPLIPIHAVLLPDGRVFSFGSQPNGSSSAFHGVDVWDNTGTPDQGHLFIANGTGNDVFCGTHLLLPPPDAASAPQVMMAGGDTFAGGQSSFVGIAGSTLFNTGSNSLAAGQPMAQPRWYASAITLVNGETYVQGGFGGGLRPEVRQLDGSYRQLSTADTSFLLWSYPRNYVMPDGRVFGYDFEGRMYFVDTAGTGRVSARTILPLQYFGTGSSAMFRPGRILQVGGNTNAAAVIDVTSGNPVFAPTQSVSSVRKLMNATLLPDGQVLVTGGSPVWNETPGANRSAEIWNPVTGQWTVGAEALQPRLYHSTALLLPDGSVITGGGGAPAPVGEDPRGEQNVEVYYPAYLFTASGQRAARPQIDQGPDSFEIGKAFQVGVTGSGVSRVTLVKTGSVTHGWNFDQRFIELTFSRQASSTATSHQLAVNPPSRPGEATPGYYMLFVFDDKGVPSLARILRLGVAGAPAIAAQPTVSSPADRNDLIGSAQALQVAATDPNGDALVYTAAGLPPGLVIDAVSGRITGTPAQAGTYYPVVSVSDGVHTSTASFKWTVIAQSALTLVIAPTPGASLVGSSASFAAQAEGVGVQYAWNFGDGSADTPWSSQPFANHAYRQPGTYVVTLKLRDASGAQLSRTFIQSAYLGHGNRPHAASSSIQYFTPHYGAPQLWVVNPDNDSITGYEAINHTRLTEIAVGAGPRTVAVAGNDDLWVTNKAGASISIIDPAKRQVLRTIALPRASQPHGVAIQRDGNRAYVALEATGELLQFDTATYAQTGRLPLGAGIRHVSVTGDGRTVYVTRFITPALPGEGSPVVGTSAGRGGEVMEVDAVTMSLRRSIVLAHSDRVDAENQGSGIPNYLGPAVISPDGTQAYVPSKQDNVRRGLLRNGQPLDFQNTVRAISSRLVLTGSNAGTEDLARRIDHDNAGKASAALFDRRGVLLFVALETTREVAVIDAHSGAQLTRFDAGRAPQGLALSDDGWTLYVSNFTDRTVSLHDLRPLLVQGVANVPTLARLSTVTTERLAPAVLQGKQLFYDARDTRLARDGYMSCAACHDDGGHDGRTWDFTNLGEGLRNTQSLRGRAGAQGRLHWSASFDEVQDFEGQIRRLAGGTGLMSDVAFNAGTRSQPLGDRKAGASVDLDALAAYLGSLDSVDPSPLRGADGSLDAAATAGRTVFIARCASCHGGTDFTDSASLASLHDIGTLKASSGAAQGAVLTGIDTPGLRDAWATAPYLHDGSAPGIADAVLRHTAITLSATDLASVSAFVAQIGREEPAVTGPPPPPPPPPLFQASPVFGSAAGTAFADTVAAGQWVTGISGRVSWRVHALQGLASPTNLPMHGGTGGSSGTLRFASGETLVRIFGRYDASGLRQIGFATSTGQVLGPYGDKLVSASSTTAFDFTVPAGQRVVGLAGRTDGTIITAVGVLYAPP